MKSFCDFGSQASEGLLHKVGLCVHSALQPELLSPGIVPSGGNLFCLYEYFIEKSSAKKRAEFNLLARLIFQMKHIDPLYEAFLMFFFLNSKSTTA